MKTVQQILESKPSGVVTIAPQAPVFDALTLMARHDIGAVVVTDGERVVGIMSERDYARKVILHNKSSREVPVSEIMSSPVISVTPAETIEDCMTLVTGRRIRHLPVIAGARLIGLLSIGDLVKALLSEQDFTIRQLEAYITSRAATPPDAAVSAWLAK